MLEAMSYGLPVLVSDIPANKEVELPAERYFRCGDVDDLKAKMEVLLEKGLSEKEQQVIRRAEIRCRSLPAVSLAGSEVRGKKGKRMDEWMIAWLDEFLWTG